MVLKIVKCVLGAILAQGIALGVIVGLVHLIPIRGTLLTIIVMPIATIIVVVLTLLSAYWAFGDSEQNEHFTNVK